MSSPESPTVVKGARRSLRLAREARKSGRGGGRSRILDEALKLFSTRGYSDVSMSDVAKAAGVTKAALYYHFADKEELYYQVSLLGIARTRDALRDALAGEGSLEERLTRASLVSFETVQANVMNLHLQAHQHLSQERHDALHRAMDALGEPLVELLAREVPSASGALSPRAAATLLGALGTATLFATNGPLGDTSELPADPGLRAALVVRLFLHGYLDIARGG